PLSDLLEDAVEVLAEGRTAARALRDERERRESIRETRRAIGDANLARLRNHTHVGRSRTIRPRDVGPGGQARLRQRHSHERGNDQREDRRDPGHPASHETNLPAYGWMTFTTTPEGIGKTPVCVRIAVSMFVRANEKNSVSVIFCPSIT